MTVLYTYFGQKERIPQIIEQELKTMIVDDCSEIPLEPIEGVTVLRILDNIMWNQPGARNLGFQELSGWVICADIDHLVTKEVYDELSKFDKKRGNVYYLGREDSNSHNIYLIHKEDFEMVGGYDEDFCGNYGYDDFHFLKKCNHFLTIVELRHIKVKVYAKESSSQLTRNSDFNSRLFASKGLNPTKRIRFNWEYVTPKQ